MSKTYHTKNYTMGEEKNYIDTIGQYVESKNGGVPISKVKMLENYLAACKTRSNWDLDRDEVLDYITRALVTARILESTK